MTMTRDWAQAEQEAAEQARASRQNVQVFAEMFLSLGGDCLKLDGARHDPELAEAKALAAHRWRQLLGLEAQIPREEARLATWNAVAPNQLDDPALRGVSVGSIRPAGAHPPM